MNELSSVTGLLVLALALVTAIAKVVEVSLRYRLARVALTSVDSAKDRRKILGAVDKVFSSKNRWGKGRGG